MGITFFNNMMFCLSDLTKDESSTSQLMSGAGLPTAMQGILMSRPAGTVNVSSKEAILAGIRELGEIVP